MLVSGNATVQSNSNSNGSITARTNQNCGDLFPFIEGLVPHLPNGYGSMPVGEVLDNLLMVCPDIFRRLDKFIDVAGHESILSDEMANSWKEKGNNEFKQQKYLESISMYSRGLMCASSDDMVATLLNNRSTAFYKLRRFADSCVDAHKCLKLKPDYWKTLARRGSALKELGFVEMGEKDIKASEEQNILVSNADTELAPIFPETGSGSSAAVVPPTAVISPKVVPAPLSSTPRRFKLVAQERLDGGTVIEETPYAAVSRLENLLAACSHCLQHTNCLYQGEEFRRANKRSRGLFCSDACATSAWKYYGAESNETDTFFLCCPNDALFAHRLLRSFTEFPVFKKVDAGKGNQTPYDQIIAEHLNNMEARVSKELDANFVAGGRETIVAAIGLYMHAWTREEADRIRIAHRQIIVNGVEIKCQLRVRQVAASAADPGNEIFSSSTIAVGGGIFAISSMLEHSCDPNCFLSFIGNPQNCSAKAVVRVIRPVLPGEPLTIAFEGLTRFKSHSKMSRIKMLQQRYGFICRCDSCSNDVDELVSSAEKETYVKASDYYQKGCRLIREGDYTTAVTVLLQSHEIVMRYICPPPRPPQPMIPATHRSLALAYFHLNDRAKCLEHLKAALETDVQIHKTDNRVEMIHEYNRLSSVAVTPVERQEYCDKAVELLERFYAPCPILTVMISMMKSVADASRASLA